MKVEIYSREAIKELMQGEFPNNTAVISFCSPRKTRRAEEVRVYFGNVCDRVFNILIPDIDIEILIRTTHYMSTKALAVLELKYSIILNWYQIYYPRGYQQIMAGSHS